MGDPIGKCFGKYRGTVIDNVDPIRLGRVQVQVPDVEAIAAWALPCVPFAGPQAGMLALPPIGAAVWVEFERGDPGYPIWTGGFWTTAEDVPAIAVEAAPGAFALTIQTPLGHVLALGDGAGEAGGLSLEVGGAFLTINDAGIHIDNGQGASISLTGASVSINDDALVVT